MRWDRLLGLVLVGIGTAGCGNPNEANIGAKGHADPSIPASAEEYELKNQTKPGRP